ncbi:competence/damage-inducible protein A [Ureibacillus suwonensis]|uniref:Putative competence-damage inducible protein n=1 Tax=Ureibacillus suwonensis TaxID=313007 RepID=A0ABW0R9Y1_9BACL
MNAEIIAVGSELLLGQIANTNAKFISAQLSEIGINVYFHSVIGDNGGRLKKAIEIAESRADLIIFSGGLGPTKDDLTKETLAEHLKVPLVYDENALATIESFFKNQGRTMTENNKKQALVLQGSEVLPNHHGLAPGMMLQKDGRTYILLPGPPKELEPMFQFEAKPRLASLISKGGVILSHVLRFYGIGEAELETEIQHILDAQANPTIAPLASDGEVMLRITAKADSKEEAWKLIDEEKQEILSIIGKYNYGTDDDTLASKTVEMLLHHKLTISAAESLTAGLFQSELAEIPGVSGALVGGMVTYTKEAKINQLGIPKELLDQHGIVSSECAASMAKNVREKFGTDIGVGLTGAAGPEPHDGEPAGTVWIGIAIGDDVVTKKLRLSGLRNTNRLRAVKYTFSYLIRLLEEKGYKKV